MAVFNKSLRGILAMLFAPKTSTGPSAHVYADTSRQYERTPTPRTPRQPIPTRLFFSPYAEAGQKMVTAPEGYAFNLRGDLVSLKREAKRRAA